MHSSLNLVDNIYMGRLESQLFTFFRCFFDLLGKTSNEHILYSKFHDYDEYSFFLFPRKK